MKNWNRKSCASCNLPIYYNIREKEWLHNTHLEAILSRCVLLGVPPVHSLRYDVIFGGKKIDA